ncbi:MAG: DNA-deoxyinosine glycosylase [Candidatus Marinimicrobia bacterium]|nr:DNA-deoxyinosine glycosylase [Candidatus Neomarinimicrobiota bacterium]|tara:strand:- start:3479 stop:3970 length:492 start_codon:yes stop_codon:yes gene_type:complete
MKKDTLKSFEPIIGLQPNFLILGTMPGKESLKKNQYYAHSRNIFWKIIYTLFNKNLSSNYLDQIKFVKENNISLWDVCLTCFRLGSLDSKIKEEIPNNIPQLLGNHPSISTIIFNGKTAEKLYRKHFKFIENKKYFTALSTSAANASYSFEQKLENWKYRLSN